MTNYLFDQASTKADLVSFFKTEKANIDSFGSSVNQTFEAYVFAKVIERFKRDGYLVTVKNPKIGDEYVFRLKFSTRGDLKTILM